MISITVRLVILCLVALATSAPQISAQSAEASQKASTEGRSFDARVNVQPPAGPASARDLLQRVELDELKVRLPDLRVELDARTGVTNTLWNTSGFLTLPDARSPQQIAQDLMFSWAAVLGLSTADLAEAELTDSVFSERSGVTHLYYRQRLQGIPTFNAQLHFNIASDGRVLSINNAFMPGLSDAVTALTPVLDAAAAVARAADHLRASDVAIEVVASASGVQQTTALSASRLSTEPIEASLMIIPVHWGVARLVWNFQIHTLDSQHVYDFTVDAATGEIWTRFDWVAADQYRVFAQPAESPNHASPPTPLDGRTLLTSPADGVASPFGWHDTNGAAGAEFTTTQGNNVHSYTDTNNDGVADPGSSPSGGAGLLFDFPIDLTQAPSAYRPAAVANLFYWSNVIHDVQHRYGFNEAAGNFQVNNYGNGGLGADDVRAEAQDSADLATRNNANFLTPPDGQRPRMQMYLWTASNPQRDSDLDTGVIVHEYGHGISNRLVGGPSNVSCLQNLQQPGEGISDWLALVYTARVGDTPTMRRGMATYLSNQPTTGNGIRGLPYSTDQSINNWTYESISSASIPHGVGAVWAQAMWEVYWALVAQHGFDPNLYNATGSAGNQRIMLYHNEGLKNTACGPTFTQVRDGIIQAAQTLHGGADVCRLWDAFAAFGLGSDAVSNGPESTTPFNGFNKPIACGGTPPPTISIDDVTAPEGSAATFTVSLNAPSPYPVRVFYNTQNGTATAGVTGDDLPNLTPITIPPTGPASVYPSSIVVPPGAGVVQAVAVTLHGYSHTWPDDVDVVLVNPSGQRIMLMSDVGGSIDAAGATLTFRDGFPALPDNGPIVSGTFRPTNIGTVDFVPGPAPPGPYSDNLGTFIGSAAEGTWNLFVYDAFQQDGGGLTGWTLHLGVSGNDFGLVSGLLTFPPGTITQPLTVPVFADGLAEPDETFIVNLTAAAAGTIADPQGIGTIGTSAGVLPPQNLHASSIVGNRVTLRWTTPAGVTPTNFLLEGGLTPGQVLAIISTASAQPVFTFDAPTGAFYVRLYTMSGAGVSAASNEIRIYVNTPTPPSPPTGLLGMVDGSSLALAWRNTFSGGAPTSITLDVSGPTSGSVPLGLVESFKFSGVPGGTYTLSVRATNAAGSSTSSNPVTLTFPGACSGAPQTPANFLAYKVANVITLLVDPAASGPAPTDFLVYLSGAFVGSFPAGTRSLTGTVGPGTYILRVSAANGCGISPPTATQTVVVP